MPVLNSVIDDIKRLNKLAHPSEQTLNQTMPHAGGAIKSGGNYREVMARQALHDGAHALRILLHELAEVVSQVHTWQSELQAVIGEHRKLV